MTWFLLRGDPVFRSSRMLLAIVLLAAGVGSLTWTWLDMHQVAAGTPHAPVFLGWPAGSLAFVAILWMSLSAHLAMPCAARRCGLFHLSLPLSARRLWLTHVAAVTLAGWVLLALGLGLALGKEQLLIRLAKGKVFEIELLVPGLHMAAGLLLAVVKLQSVRPTLCRVPLDAVYVLRVVLTMAAILLLVLLLNALGSAAVLVTLAAAAALGWWTCRTLPPSLLLLPREPEPGEEIRPRTPEEEATPPGRRALFARTIGRTLLGGKAIGMAPIVLLYGLLVSGQYPEMASADMRLFFLALTWYLLLSWGQLHLRKLYLLDYLPISRRVLFAASVAPGLLCLALGYGIGGWGDGLRQRPYERGFHQNRHLSQDVPVEFFAVAWDGRIPLLDTPWGESREPWSIPLFKGSRIALYAPYTSPDSSSAEFAARQLSRAIAAFYGDSVDSEIIAARYLEEDEKNGVRLRRNGDPLLADYPRVLHPIPNGALPVFMLLAGAPGLLFFGLLLRRYRTDLPSSDWNAGTVTAMILGLGGALGTVVADISGLMDPGTPGALLNALMWLVARSLPGGTSTLWALAALLLVWVYLWTQEQFLRFEFPLPRARGEDSPSS